MRGASRNALAAAQERLDAVLGGSRDASAALALARALLQVATLLSGERSLARSLSDPGIDAAARRNLVDAVFRGKVDDDVLDLLQVVTGERWSQEDDLVDGVETLGAQAAFTAAERDGTLEDTEDELFRFARIVDGAPDLRTALADPRTPVEAKRRLVQSLLEGKVGDVTLLLAEHVVAAPRGRAADRAIDELAAQAAARKQRVIAVVTSAVPLSSEQTDALAESLGRVLGHDVHLQTRTDPEILGGVVIRVGDELFDGSVLARMSAARTLLTR
ncbi:MAG TPA: F0F1 ATP synthase subunit delta [Mycobacteriales bacterium]